MLDSYPLSFVAGAQEYERDTQSFPDEEYEEIMEKLQKPTSIPYNEYTLEEIIYQLAKVAIMIPMD